MDILNEVYKILTSNSFIQSEVEDRIKFCEYPESGDKNGPIIVIDEVDSDSPSDYADDVWLTSDYFIHIEVWTQGENGRTKRDTIAKEIRSIMWNELRFKHVSSMKPEYDSRTKTWRDARRYRGKLYRKDLDTL